jgi:hypothetical protein
MYSVGARGLAMGLLDSVAIQTILHTGQEPTSIGDSVLSNSIEAGTEDRLIDLGRNLV